MQLAHATDIRPLLPAVKAHMRDYRFLVIVKRSPLDDTLYLYGSKTSNHDALTEALTDFPFAKLMQEAEYLPPEVLAHIRSLRDADPVSQALQALGKIDPTTYGAS